MASPRGCISSPPVAPNSATEPQHIQLDASRLDLLPDAALDVVFRNLDVITKAQVLQLVCKALRIKLQEPGPGVWGDVAISLDCSDDGTGALPATELLVDWLRTRKRGLRSVTFLSTSQKPQQSERLRSFDFKHLAAVLSLERDATMPTEASLIDDCARIGVIETRVRVPHFKGEERVLPLHGLLCLGGGLSSLSGSITMDTFEHLSALTNLRSVDLSSPLTLHDTAQLTAADLALPALESLTLVHFPTRLWRPGQRRGGSPLAVLPSWHAPRLTSLTLSGFQQEEARHLSGICRHEALQQLSITDGNLRSRDALESLDLSSLAGLTRLDLRRTAFPPPQPGGLLPELLRSCSVLRLLMMDLPQMDSSCSETLHPEVVSALLSMPSLAAVRLTHSPWYFSSLPGAAVEALAAQLAGSGLHLTVDPSAVAAAEARPRYFGPEATTASTDVDT